MLVDFQALFLILDHVVAHEAKEALGVLRRMHGRNARTMSQERLLEEVFTLLIEVEVLQVVDDSNMIDVATASRQELMARAHETRPDHT